MNQTAPIAVAVVEDEPLFLDLLRTALSHAPAIELLDTFRRGDEALRRIPDLNPQVVVMDIDLGGAQSGIQLALLLREQLPNIGVVLLSNHWVPHFLASLPPESMTGWCYLLKRSVADVETLVHAIQGAAAGLVVLDPYIVARRRPRPGGALSRLSGRQRDVLAFIAQGLTNAAIAEHLHVAPSTVENQVNLIYQTLDLGQDTLRFNPRVRAALLFLLETQAASEPSSIPPASG